MTDAPVTETREPTEAPPTRLKRFWQSDFMWSFRHAPVAVVSFCVVVLLVAAARLAALQAPV